MCATPLLVERRRFPCCSLSRLEDNIKHLDNVVHHLASSYSMLVSVAFPPFFYSWVTRVSYSYYTKKVCSIDECMYRTVSTHPPCTHALFRASPHFLFFGKFGSPTLLLNSRVVSRTALYNCDMLQEYVTLFNRCINGSTVVVRQLRSKGNSRYSNSYVAQKCYNPQK